MFCCRSRFFSAIEWLRRSFSHSFGQHVLISRLDGDGVSIGSCCVELVLWRGCCFLRRAFHQKYGLRMNSRIPISAPQHRKKREIEVIYCFFFFDVGTVSSACIGGRVSRVFTSRIGIFVGAGMSRKQRCSTFLLLILSFHSNFPSMR